MGDKNLYDVLGAKRDATPNALRKAYKKAMLRTHPDKARATGGSPSAFIAVQKAYKVLSNKHARARYDAQLRVNGRSRSRLSTARRGYGGFGAKANFQTSWNNIKRHTKRRQQSKRTSTTAAPSKPYVGIRIAIMLDGSWVKGFLKSYEERSSRSSILCDTGVLHKCTLSEKTYQLLDYYDRPSGKVHYGSRKKVDYGVFWPWAKKGRTKGNHKKSRSDASSSAGGFVKWYYLGTSLNTLRRFVCSSNAPFLYEPLTTSRRRSKQEKTRTALYRSYS